MMKAEYVGGPLHGQAAPLPAGWLGDIVLAQNGEGRLVLVLGRYLVREECGSVTCVWEDATLVE